MGCDEVHSLEVADFGVPFDEGSENVAQLGLELGASLDVFNVWVCSKNVELDLLKVGIRVQLGLTVLELLIVARV